MGLRLDTIPIWYPYAVNFRLMLEAQAELQVALLRHIAPLVDLLDRTSIQEECAEELNRQLKAYVGYFEGGMDRLWAGGIRSQTPECAVAGSDILDAHRNKRLYERLSELFGSLTVLLKDNGAIPGEELRIWWTDENPEKVWYQQTLSQQDLR